MVAAAAAAAKLLERLGFPCMVVLLVLLLVEVLLRD
jgi:hypothetical protein